MTEKRTFKWGDSEYLLDDLLTLHAAQENNFYNFARDRGQYDDTAIQGLRQAIEKEINAAKNGEHFEADGSLATDVVDNVSIQTLKKGLFKKEKYTNQDNTSWAKYYINKLISNLKKYNKESKDKGWDMSKHGLSAYFNGQGLNAKEIFENYDKRDKDNPDNPRSFEQRNQLLKERLINYRDWISGENFNFSENDNAWDDNHISDLNDLITNFDTYSLDGSLSSRLRKLGADDAYITAFTSDRFNLSKTDEELDEENKKLAEAKKLKENTEAYNTAIGNYYGIYSGLSPKTGQMTAYLGQYNSNFYRTPEELLEWAKTNKSDIESYQKHYDEDKWDTEAAQYILPMMQANNRLMEATIDGTKYVYDPNTIDRTNHSFIAINPVTGVMEQRFLYDLENEMNALRNKYLKPQGASRYQIDVESHKEGGIISMQTGGGFNAVDYLQSLSDSDYKKRAKEKGVDERVLRESERTPFGEKTTINNSGLTGADLARLATIGADITSMFLDPISGTTVGVGSSLVNFGADVVNDGFQLKDLGNLGINVGLDLLGTIPLFGDAVGTGTKIIRNLAKWTPRILAGLAGIQGVANMGEIMNSISKIGNKDEKLTVQDWRNISLGISLLTGGVRAIKNKSAQHKVIKDAKTDAIVVGVRNKNNEAVEHVIVNGETALQIKNNKNDAKKIEEILLKNKEFKDKFGDSNTWTIDIKKGERQFPIRRIKDDLDGKKHLLWEPRKKGLPSILHYYDFNKIRGYSSSWGWTPRIFGSTVNNWHNKTIKSLNSDVDSSLDIRNWNARTSTNKQEIIEKARLDLLNLLKITKPKKPKNPTSELLQQYNDDYIKYRDYISNKLRLLGIIQGNSLTLKKQGGSINRNKLNKFLNYGKR